MIKRQLLHEQIADVLRDEILTKHSPGDRLDADTKQAERFSTSVITIRDAMRLLCQEGILLRKHGSGTYVRDRRQVGTIAVIASEDVLSAPKSFYFLAAFRRVQRKLEDAHWSTTLLLDPRARRIEESKTAEDLLLALGENPSRPIKGAVAVVAGSPRMGLLEEKDIPVVGGWPGSKYVVHNDHEQHVREATQYLLELGRRRIAFLQPVSLDANPEWFLQRVFREELEKAGVPFRKDWVCGDVDPTAPNSCWDRFRAMWGKDKEKPDALLVALDSAFRDAVPAILSLNLRVPKDLVVVTHANKGSDILYPFPTARVEFDPMEYADKLVDMLLKRIEKKNIRTKQVTLSHEWVGKEEVEEALRKAT